MFNCVEAEEYPAMLTLTFSAFMPVICRGTMALEEMAALPSSSVMVSWRVIPGDVCCQSIISTPYVFANTKVTQNKLNTVSMPEKIIRIKNLHNPLFTKSSRSPCLMASPRASVKREGGGRFMAMSMLLVALRDCPVANPSPSPSRSLPISASRARA